jgi:hypothetical protein
MQERLTASLVDAGRSAERFGPILSTPADQERSRIRTRFEFVLDRLTRITPR